MECAVYTQSALVSALDRSLLTDVYCTFFHGAALD